MYLHNDYTEKTRKESQEKNPQLQDRQLGIMWGVKQKGKGNCLTEEII